MHADPNALKCSKHGTVKGVSVQPTGTRLEQAQYARREAKAYAQLVAGNGHDKLLEDRIRKAFLAGWDAAQRSANQAPR